MPRPRDSAIDIGRRLWHDSTVSRRFPQPRRYAAAMLLFGLILTALAAAAILSANNLLFVILAALLATWMVSDFIGRLSLSGLELDFRLPEHVSAGRRFPAHIFVRNHKRWVPSFSVKLSGTSDSVFSSMLYFPLLQGRKTLDEIVDVEFARRGIHREDEFWFSTAFPFGLRERRAQVSLRREILVYPCLNPQPGFEDLLGVFSGEVAAHYRGRGHDFYRIRPYEALESARHVDWKATAHTGAIQVREFAREEEPLVEILLDLDAPEPDRVWFERAVECCAFLTWHLTQRETRVRFATQEFAITVPAMGDIYTILKYLALVAPKPTGLSMNPAEESSFHIVFTAAPEAFPEPGWRHARFVTPRNFPALVV
jgi:uncharacterized protein (DUF58 family)